MVNRVRITDVAESTPFDNDTNGFIADNTQAAIEEVKINAGLSRFSVNFAYGSNSGRWLELFQTNASNTSPFVVAEPGIITSLGLSNKNSASGATFTVYVNGVAEATIDMGDGTGETDTGYKVLSTPIDLLAGDEISAQQTSTPSTSEPNLSVNIKVLA